MVQIALSGAADGPDDALNGKAEGLVRQRGYVQAVSPVDGGIAVTVENGSAAVRNGSGRWFSTGTNGLRAAGWLRPATDQCW